MVWVRRAALGLWVVQLALGAGCRPSPKVKETPLHITPPLGLPPIAIPSDNPPTVEKVTLGRQLYYDRRVASQAHSSCADCHEPDHGFAGRDPTMAFHRNSPTVINRAYGTYEFWDGSAGRSLEELVDGVLRFVNHGASQPLGTRLNAIPGYRRSFNEVFGRDADQVAAVQAIATYCRTLLSGGSSYDRFTAGEAGALTPAAQKGKELFFGKAGCSSCHSGPNFTDERFHNIGIGQEDPQKEFYPHFEGKPDHPELGRFNLTNRIEDRGAFKTPTLRELTRTDPYMHDGRFATLTEVVEYYDHGGLQAIGTDPRVHPLGLTAAEKADLVEFLESLSTDAPVPPPPALPDL